MAKSQPSRPRKAPTTRYGFLTVGQTARILGVSPSTLRLWESEGLVAPLRTGGRYRLYSPELLQVLKRIKYLREVQRLNMPGIRRELTRRTRGISTSRKARAVHASRARRPFARPQGGRGRRWRRDETEARSTARTAVAAHARAQGTGTGGSGAARRDCRPAS